MKNIIITGLLLVTVFYAEAQELFGRASFTVPAGWQMTTTSETVTLQRPAQKGVTCKIIISNATQGAVSTNAEYLQYRAANGGRAIIYDNRRGAVTKYEANGLISFFSKGSTTINMVRVNSYFYSVSNGSHTLYYQLFTSNNDCINEFNQFMAELKMEPKDIAEANARAKKAAPAPVPAAPAPAM